MTDNARYGFDSVPESIRRVLEDRIVGEGLEPGVRLGLKSELQREFGVAGPTIDQALKLLANDGLITIRRGPGGGVFVARSQPVLRLGSKQLTARDAATLGENIELREALASLVGVSAARATERDPEALAALAQLTDELGGSDPLSFDTQRKIWAAHRVLMTLCDSATLRLIYTNLLEAAEALIVEVEIPETATQLSRERRRIDAHLGLFRSVLDGDVDAAHEFGQLVRIVSPLGRGGHRVAVGKEPPVPLWADAMAGDTAAEPPGTELRLGLLGANIARSMAPFFHVRAGELDGTAIVYDLLEHPAEAVDLVPGLIGRYRDEGYDAINVTYPFKEAAASVCTIEDTNVAAIGAVNTIRFDDLDGDATARGHNTDFTGLQRAWRRRWPERRPGVVAVLGAGGVGRSSALALAGLGATELRLFDADPARAERLRQALLANAPGRPVHVAESAVAAVEGADGIVNGTPVGMYFSPGTPVALASVGTQAWVFDAVYTPVETPLLRRATDMGIDILTGFELFLAQAIDAYEVFARRALDDAVISRIEVEMWELVRTRPT